MNLTFSSPSSGICCAFGSGSYEVTVNGVSEATGGEFTSTESTSFGTCQSTPVPSASPSSSPTVSISYDRVTRYHFIPPNLTHIYLSLYISPLQLPIQHLLLRNLPANPQLRRLVKLPWILQLPQPWPLQPLQERQLKPQLLRPRQQLLPKPVLMIPIGLSLPIMVGQSVVTGLPKRVTGVIELVMMAGQHRKLVNVPVLNPELSKCIRRISVKIEYIRLLWISSCVLYQTLDNIMCVISCVVLIVMYHCNKE